MKTIKNKKRILGLSAIWGLVIFVYLYLGQMDLMRHIFVTVCHEIGDIWTVGFGFPLWNPWKPTWSMPIQVAFDISYAIIGMCSFMLGAISTYLMLRGKEELEK